MSWYISECSPIYVDNNSTAPLDKRVKDAIVNALDDWANPSSNSAMGKRAREKIEYSRKQVATMLCVEPESVFFTSSASEANNWVIDIAMEHHKICCADESKPHIITCSIEHPSILKKLKYISRIGKIDLSLIGICPDSGMVKVDEILKALKHETCLVTIMFANNETGVIQPIKEILSIIKNFNRKHNTQILMHSDATQAIGKMVVDFTDTEVDFISLSGHKFCGPRSGALVIRNEKTVPVFPYIHGGGQERGMRGGTENTPMIVGLGKACEIVSNELHLFMENYVKVRNYFETKIKDVFSDKVTIHFESFNRLMNTSSVAFLAYNDAAADLLSKCKTFVASTGSACHSNSIKASSILIACGISENAAIKTVRFSFGRGSCIEDVDKIVDELMALMFFNKFGISLLNALGNGPVAGF